MNNDLKIIKKLYGEKMMHLCKELFPTILERSGVLCDILQSLFEPSKILYDDIVNQNVVDEFKNCIYTVYDDRYTNKKKIIVNETPSELLSKAGYDLFECKTEKDIQKFRKYYRYGEELCTFNGGRLDNCYVFFAVKKDVKRIKRSDFKNPQRQDEYGTSVISIQFSKDSHNTLSIKNRYNHKVPNPDATFSNNLDNIIPGLTESFRKYYKFNLKNTSGKIVLLGYVRSNGKYYKYNYLVKGIYYCPENIIIDNFQVKRDYQEMERYIVLDYFIIDLKEKKIELYDKSLDDTFIKDLINIDKISILKDKETGNKEIIILIEGQEPIVIIADSRNNMIGYKNSNVEEIKNGFLMFDTKLKELYLPNVKTIGHSFLRYNRVLNKVYLPKVETIGHYFLQAANELSELYLPNVKTIGDSFLWANYNIKKACMPNLEKIGGSFFENNIKMKTIIGIKMVTKGLANKINKVIKNKLNKSRSIGR